MTTAQLYAIYARAYRDAPRLVEAGVDSALVSHLDGRSAHPPVARVIALLALDDATNGRPLRSRQHFERAVAHGVGALGPLGLREVPRPRLVRGHLALVADDAG